MPTLSEHTLQAAQLRKLSKTIKDKQKGELIRLRVLFEEDKRLLANVVNKLVDIDRIYPRHLPTQASFRWSTLNPAVTNWPRRCINQECGVEEHEWTEECWSIRDVLAVEEDEVLVTWDHDNAEGRIHDLIVDDKVGLLAYEQGYDLHTITCCKMFGYALPPNLYDPHKSAECAEWRQEYKWQGKDTRQRVLAKNFNHGSKYSKSYRFVHMLPDVERYGADRKQLTILAKKYIEEKGECWQRKLDIMQQIRKNRVARTLYGARRMFFDSSEDTEKEGFSHMVSGTMSGYNDMTLILLEETFGNSFRLLHNAHDGNKIAIKKDHVAVNFGQVLSGIIEREVVYQGRGVRLTAGIQVKGL